MRTFNRKSELRNSRDGAEERSLPPPHHRVYFRGIEHATYDVVLSMKLERKDITIWLRDLGFKAHVPNARSPGWRYASSLPTCTVRPMPSQVTGIGTSAVTALAKTRLLSVHSGRPSLIVSRARPGICAGSTVARSASSFIEDRSSASPKSIPELANAVGTSEVSRMADHRAAPRVGAEPVSSPELLTSGSHHLPDRGRLAT